jgi:exoribonuclease-2
MPRAELAFLFRLAQHLKAQREVVRGEPETFNRPDYNFRLVGNDGAEPRGHEQVQISVRQRGAPLDLMVAEAMILANSTWGQWMSELGVPAIYRSQASLLPGVKVRMGTKALPHAGIGVPSYAWSTSPLRRYTDLVNQWQIVACAQHGSTAALAAPFKPKDADLFAIISAFDTAYTTYNGYQNSMERFWTLQYVRQQHITELTATVFKTMPGQPPMARADDLPLVLPVVGGSNLQRGAKVQLRLSDIDDISLDIQGQLLHVLDDAQAHPAEDVAEDDDDSTAGPIAVALDVNDASDDTGASA